MTIDTRPDTGRQRNRGYQRSHRKMIEIAVRLISEKGVDALSLAELARELDLNRTTIYYHFKNRDSLIREVKKWSSEQLARGLDFQVPQQDRIDYITRFALQNPELIRLWVEDLMSGADIEACYPMWHQLVRGMQKEFDRQGQPLNAEIYCLNLLITAIVTPHVYRNSVQQKAATETIVGLFREEHQRRLASEQLLSPPSSG